MAAPTMNGKAMGKVESISVTKDSNIITLPFPTQDSSATELYDFQGATRNFNIGGVFVIEESTTINASTTAVATTITVVSTTGFPTSGYIEIGNTSTGFEVVKYTGVGATTFTGCTRGQDNSTALSFSTSVPVVRSPRAQMANLAEDLDGEQSTTLNFVSDQMGTISGMLANIDFTWDIPDNKLRYSIRFVEGTAVA